QCSGHFPAALKFGSSKYAIGSSVVHPVKTRSNGEFLSHSLSHHFSGERVRHDLQPQPLEEQVYYKVEYKGDTIAFNLSANTKLVSNGYTQERRNGGTNKTGHHSTKNNYCHHLGTVATSKAIGTAAISTCNGLRGLFSLLGDYYFIEPVQKHPADTKGSPEPHVIYPRTTTTSNRIKRSTDVGPKDRVQVEKEREEWERDQRTGTVQSRQPRSVSKERWVETMVVADSKLIDYHGSDNVESYIFTIMNMVAGIFHDASIGNAIHVILVRLILLQGEEKGLKIVHHADTTLASFCAWQKNINPQSDTHPAHHDLAVLVTRKDICAGMNQPCETLGLSHLSGMCQPHRSCNINEDSGLPVAFTIAHEMGHSFGIHHDGQGNDCEMDGRHPFIMSRQLMYDSSPLTWSPCSKEYITRFLDRGWGFCLDDRPSKKELATPLANLGVRYTTHHQCQLQYGPNATFCSEVDNVCQFLWCSVNGSCRSKLDSPIDGTRCGPGKWCISGECVIVGKLPETVNGGWGPWSTWSYCSRTCGTGVQSADRECNSPKPEFGGKYCTGERKRYRTCNTKPCLNDMPSFREMQCSEFNTVPYHNELYQWIPVANYLNPCELHCRPVNEYFSEKMLDTVTDGTPCFMNNKSRNICVNGVCKEVGCDFGIDSNAVEDRCGVCLGDGSSCETIYNLFDEGDGYINVGVIPEGARDIQVTEVEEAGNFLALKRPDSEEYFLNGNYIIQWNGEYEAGGTTFYYERTANMENLTAPGPTEEPVILQLLYQENNPGIKYEYIVKKARRTGNEITEHNYTWRHGAWTHCSTTCGLGEQHQPVRCFEVDVGVVDDSLCDPDTQPQDRYRKCKNMDCPARWWVGGWQHCTATCGSEGVRSRTVLCVRTVSGEETVLHPFECKHLLKPKRMVPCNRDVPCGRDWIVGEWEECPVTCGGGVRSRTVTCALDSKKGCNMTSKPRSRSLCGLQSCPNLSLRRRPGPPPKYRRLYPPKRQPTKPADFTSTWFPTITTSTAAPMQHPKANRSKKQNIPSSDQNNLMARKAVVKGFTWVVGNWSECSTTCGIGAMWRTVVCSSQNEKDCASSERPEPARTCQLQPCAAWQSGSWSKCPDECAAVGRRHRDVQCVDSQSQRPLRPFHCQALSSKPISTLTCPRKLCLSWSTSPWGPCSGSCGAGIRERLVYCPEANRCSDPMRPNSTELCTLKPCVHWTNKDWNECSVSCGGGQQQRDITCVTVENMTVMPNNLCEKEPKPDTLRKCNVQECKVSFVCKKNSMSSRFCDKLKLLSRCSFRSIQKQCCVTSWGGVPAVHNIAIGV
uniref:ADAM metallopeptidase with thrombospondin type 1 motif, 12 n=1 Tax=Neogobius melanostomus TaxID=47308 RepID=A0A8C6WFW9_9GOBI